MWYSNDLDVARERHKDLIRQAERERLVLYLLENQRSQRRSNWHRLGRQIRRRLQQMRFRMRVRPARYRVSHPC